MFQYHAVRVTNDPARSSTGRALWEFLNSDEAFARMETATLLDRPAIEGLIRPIEKRFGLDVNDPSWKPLIARKVREVMTERGYLMVNRGEVFRDLDLFIERSAGAERHEYDAGYSGFA